MYTVEIPRFIDLRALARLFRGQIGAFSGLCHVSAWVCLHFIDAMSFECFLGCINVPRVGFRAPDLGDQVVQRGLACAAARPCGSQRV